MNVIYECNGCDNIFTREKLLKIREREAEIRAFPKFELTCLAKSIQDSSCSEIALFSPTVMFQGVGANLEDISQD